MASVEIREVLVNNVLHRPVAAAGADADFGRRLLVKRHPPGTFGGNHRRLNGRIRRTCPWRPLFL